MNRLRQLAALEEVWQALSPVSKASFEEVYGSWDGLDYSQRKAYLGRFFKAQDEDREGAAQAAERERYEQAIGALSAGLEGMSAQLGSGIGSIRRDQAVTGSRLEDLEKEVRQRVEQSPPNQPRQADRTPEPSPSPGPTIPVLANCEYAADGPKECVVVTMVGGRRDTYCRKAVEIVGRAIIAPEFSSMREKVRCPSKWYRPCELLLKAKTDKDRGATHE